MFHLDRQGERQTDAVPTLHPARRPQGAEVPQGDAVRLHADQFHREHAQALVVGPGHLGAVADVRAVGGSGGQRSGEDEPLRVTRGDQADEALVGPGESHRGGSGVGGPPDAGRGSHGPLRVPLDDDCRPGALVAVPARAVRPVLLVVGRFSTRLEWSPSNERTTSFHIRSGRVLSSCRPSGVAGDEVLEDAARIRDGRAPETAGRGVESSSCGGK